MTSAFRDPLRNRFFAHRDWLTDDVGEKERKMFEGLFQPMHLLIIAGIALLVFGPRKLPELGKGLGESIRGFKSAMAAKEEATNVKPDATPDRSRPAVEN